MSNDTPDLPDDVEPMLDLVRDNALQLLSAFPRPPSVLRIQAGGVSVEAEWSVVPSPSGTIAPATVLVPADGGPAPLDNAVDGSLLEDDLLRYAARASGRRVLPGTGTRREAVRRCGRHGRLRPAGSYHRAHEDDGSDARGRRRADRRSAQSERRGGRIRRATVRRHASGTVSEEAHLARRPLRRTAQRPVGWCGSQRGRTGRPRVLAPLLAR